MKKLSFALACACSVSLFADLSNIIGFEQYTVPTNGLSLKTDSGESGAATASYWLYNEASGSTDGSTVKAYGGDNLTAPTVGGDHGKNYLELSTEGGTLWRSVNTLADSTNLGAAQTIGSDGIYVDTLVQFTPTEDGGTPDVDTANGDKLAIWLNVDSSGATPVTNLMVRAGYIDDQAQPVATNYVLTGKTIDAGAWYRLTVKATADICGGESELHIPAFTVMIDGTALSATTSAIDSDLQDQMIQNSWLSSSVQAELAAKTLFPSLQQADSAANTLQAVGFKGSGAIDNLGITDTNPLPAPSADIEFTITTADGVTAEWSTDGSTWTAYTSGAAAAAGDLYIRLTNADGAVKTLAKTTLSSDSNAFDESAETFGWDEYLGAAVEGAYQIVDANALTMLQKGVTAGLATTGIAFKQTADINMASTATAGWDGIGGKKGATPFAGTYDGAGYTISNLTFARQTYRGLFDSIENAAISNLTVNVAGFIAGDDEAGFAAIVGYAKTSVLQNLTATGTIGSSTAYAHHTCAGIAVSFGGSILACTNKATIFSTCDNTKVGGIVGIVQGAATTITGCVNEGDLTANKGEYDNEYEKDPYVEGVGGIVGYNQIDLTLANCENSGTLTDETSSGRAGQLIGHAGAKALTGTGVNKGLAVGDYAGLNQATSKTGFDLKYVAGTTAEWYPESAMYTLVMAKQQSGVVAGSLYSYVDKCTITGLQLNENSMTAGTITADSDSTATTASLTTKLGAFLSAYNGKDAAAGGVYDLVLTGTDPNVWTVAADTLAGSGTEADPWVIDSVRHLKVFRAGVNAGTYALENQYFVQTADIDLGGEEWTGIGASLDTCFCGHYDGQNHTINNFVVGTPSYAGLFSCISGGSVKNLKILDVTSLAGAKAVCVGFGDVEPPAGKFFLAENVTVGGTVSGVHNVGGLTSWTQGDVRLISCTNLANCTTTRAKVGGLTPIHASGSLVGPLLVSNCCNKGAITLNKNASGDATFAAGGLVAFAQGTLSVTIVDSVNEGAVSGLWTESTSIGTSVIGGIFGQDTGGVTLTIRNCSNTGAVSANVASCATQNAKVGGIVGAVLATTKLHLEDVTAGGTVSATVAEGRTAKVGSFVGEAFAYDASTDAGLWLTGQALTALPQFAETLATVGGYTATKTEGDYTVYYIAPYPSYIDASDAVKKAKYDAWKATYGADTESAYEKAFLLNVAPANAATAEAAFKILSITMKADGSVEVVTTEGPVDGKAYNGTIEIRGSATLTGTYTTGAVTEKSAKFFKAYLK